MTNHKYPELEQAHQQYLKAKHEYEEFKTYQDGLKNQIKETEIKINELNKWLDPETFEEYKRQVMTEGFDVEAMKKINKEFKDKTEDLEALTSTFEVLKKSTDIKYETLKDYRIHMDSCEAKVYKEMAVITLNEDIKPIMKSFVRHFALKTYKNDYLFFTSINSRFGACEYAFGNYLAQLFNEFLSDFAESEPSIPNSSGVRDSHLVKPFIESDPRFKKYEI